MSDINTAPSEQPAQDPSPAVDPGAQPESQDPSATIQSLDLETLGNVLFSERDPETSADTPPTPAQQPAPAPEPTQPEGGEQPPSDGKPDLRRIALGGVPMSERQQLAEVARMIRTGEATSTVEALQKMGALPAANQAEPTPPDGTEPPPVPAPEEPPAPTGNDRLAELKASIEDLRAQRKAAKADFDTEEEERLTALIEDQVGELALARIEAAEQAAQASTWQESYVAAVDEMEANHEWATDPDSPLYEALNDKVTAAMARQDPALQNPRYILEFAKQIETRFGKVPARPVPPPPPPNPARRILGGGVAPGHSEAHTPTEAESKALIHSATKEELAAALFS